MKWLILILAIPVTNLFAEGEMPIIRDAAQGIASNIRDVEVENLLRESSEFQSCRSKYEFKPNQTNAQRTADLQKAEQCIRDQMTSDPKRLKELSDTLRLQDFGLVKGEAISDIQKYFNRKMSKALTGVDPEERDQQKIMDDLKWGRKKVVDQSIFFDLYNTQLTKSALYEVSRFCFQNFRLVTAPANINSFGEYWKDFTPTKYQLSEVTDVGNGKFGVITKPDDKDQIYKDILQGVNVGGQNSMPANMMKEFFQFCGKQIRPLCDEFKKAKVTTGVNQTQASSNSVIADSTTPGATPTATQPTATPANLAGNTTTRGAEACLSLNRLQSIRGAIEDIKKVKDGLKEFEVGPEHMQALFAKEPPRLFKAGEDGAEDIDNLTIGSSKDVLEGTGFKDKNENLDDCLQNNDFDSCKGFITNKEDLEKARQKIELEGTIAREVELERVRKIKDQGKQKLEDYLKENGFFGLAEELKNNRMSEDKIIEEVGKEMEAKKIATIEALNKKLGSRQASEDDPSGLSAAITAGTTESKEERARLAQVVLFNNVITSHLDLTRSDGSSAGQNINAWKREEQDLKGAGVQDQYFQNMAATSSGNSQGASGADEIGGLGLIENILGKPKQP